MRTTFAIFALAALTASAPALAAPSAADILSANAKAAGQAALNGKATIKTATAFQGMGMTGTTQSLTDLKTGHYVDSFHIGPATGANGFNGKNAWAKDSSGTVTLQQGGEQRELAVNEAYRRANLWWQPDRGGATITAAEKTEDGKTYDVLNVTPKGGKNFDAWFDTKTHQLVRITEKQGPNTVTTKMSGYESEGGVMLPKTTTVDSGVGAKYIQTITLTKAEFLPAQPATAYDPPKVQVTDFSIAGGKSETTFPIQLINNHIYAQAKVNGKGPFTFIFDTGGHNIVVPDTAKELGLKVEGKLPVSGAGEKIMEGGFTHAKSISVADATVKNQLIMVLPLDTLAHVEGTKMPGMIGYEVFRRFVTRIDYGAKTMTLIDPKKFDAKDAGTPVKFTFNGSIPEVMGTFEGIPAKFDIDTGARSELTLTKPFAEKNKLRATHPKGVEAADGWGVGGPSRGYVTMGKNMTLSDVKLDNVVTSLATQDKGAFAGADYSGNVGGGILKRFTVTFDYDNMVMYLKPRTGKVADIGTFDRSGMWINDTTGKDAGDFVIADITAKGPAETAGLKKGDVITKVDGKPATDMHLYDLRQRLRNDAPGTKVVFTVKHGDETHDVTVTLKKQI